jgi:hypothetical protein
MLDDICPADRRSDAWYDEANLTSSTSMQVLNFIKGWEMNSHVELVRNTNHTMKPMNDKIIREMLPLVISRESRSYFKIRQLL